MQGYPGITPFEGMASGVAALFRHLPAGSPAIFYCIHCLVEKANKLCIEDVSQHTDMWKNWQGDSESGKKLLDLLLRLISLVDIQVRRNGRFMYQKFYKFYSFLIYQFWFELI